MARTAEERLREEFELIAKLRLLPSAWTESDANTVALEYLTKLLSIRASLVKVRTYGLKG